MNQIQKQKAIDIVSQDCEIKHYYCKGGKTCALGKLALETGIGMDYFNRFIIKKSIAVRQNNLIGST